MTEVNACMDYMTEEAYRDVNNFDLEVYWDIIYIRCLFKVHNSMVLSTFIECLYFIITKTFLFVFKDEARGQQM